jgi:integrase
MEAIMVQKWVQKARYWISRRPVRPGVWRMKGGGYFVRKRVTDPLGKLREVVIPLPDANVDEAEAALRLAIRRIRQSQSAEQTRTTFGDYAVSLLKRKIERGEMRSAKTRAEWAYVLELHLLPAFGSTRIEEIRRSAVENWKDRVAVKLRAGEYAPATANGWIKILRAIINSAVAELELERNPVLGVKDFDTSAHHTYTEEQPNSLTPDEVSLFLAEMRKRFPQHFAMVALGFATGLRPSSMRPLRRGGATPDVLWEQGVLLVRRSQTMGLVVMERTKTGRNQRLTLPKEVMEILRWHVENLPEGPMRDSELLFPSETGGFRACSCLDKPFREVARAMGLSKRLTPRAMRRTFQDLARAVQVPDVVTRAVSGHVTEAMQRHYSTVSGEEMRENLAKVISLARVREAMAAEQEPQGHAEGEVG